LLFVSDSSQQQRHHHASSKARGFVEYIAPASLASTISISALAEPPAKSPRVLELTSGDVNKLREQFMQQLERLDRQEKSLQERLAKTQKKKTKLKEAAAQLDTSVVDK
jgi:predicted Ser/Thr protein kinase